MEQHCEIGLWVGVDWGSELHQVCVLDAQRKVVGERKFEHSGATLGEMADWVTSLSPGGAQAIGVAIEVPRGPVVETLLERQMQVFAINPKQLDRFRDRHTVAGAKDDRRDAFVLADSLRTDAVLFRRLKLDDPTVIELREMTRVEDDLSGSRNRLINRLREQLHRYFVQLLKLCPSADEPWLWDLLELVPTPEKARKLPKAEIAKILRRNRIRRLDADAVQKAIAAPSLVVAPGVPDAASRHVRILIPQLRLLRSQTLDCQQQVEKLLEKLAAPSASADTDAPGQPSEHRDVEILRSLPGVGRKVAAVMLAEAGEAIVNRDYHALRSLAGIAPVTIQSGKRHSVLMRRACNERLRNALYHWSRVSTQCDELARATYTALRKRGHSHGRALRSVADRNLRIFFAMLKSVTLYDSAMPGRARADQLSSSVSSACHESKAA